MRNWNVSTKLDLLSKSAKACNRQFVKQQIGHFFVNSYLLKLLILCAQCFVIVLGLVN